MTTDKLELAVAEAELRVARLRLAIARRSAPDGAQTVAQAAVHARRGSITSLIYEHFKGGEVFSVKEAEEFIQAQGINPHPISVYSGIAKHTRGDRTSFVRVARGRYRVASAPAADAPAVVTDDEHGAA